MHDQLQRLYRGGKNYSIVLYPDSFSSVSLKGKKKETKHSPIPFKALLVRTQIDMLPLLGRDLQFETLDKLTYRVFSGDSL